MEIIDLFGRISIPTLLNKKNVENQNKIKNSLLINKENVVNRNKIKNSL